MPKVDWLKHVLDAPLVKLAFAFGRMFVGASFLQVRRDRTGLSFDWPTSPNPWVLLVGCLLVTGSLLAGISGSRLLSRYLKRRDALRVLAGKWQHGFQHPTGTSEETAEITKDQRYLVNGEHRFDLDLLQFDAETGALALEKKCLDGTFHSLEALLRQPSGRLEGHNHMGREVWYARDG